MRQVHSVDWQDNVTINGFKMKELAKMRLGVLRELKNVKRFFDTMEKSVKSMNPEAIQKSYMFLVHLVYEMDKGTLTPENIALDLEFAREIQQ